ncbi:MAG: hypothetical protein FD139_27 [Methylocystaceae bacterium]|nr:MAG: hypothetical protein FD148_548 [Methylocystaceae bacterium]KAF0208583.1 MAG: hypothetical protein FD172_3454 [Methylocystaceae bacterium]TXT48417.1 MAG: hypothetical protein FD139_27 [Methylocystaceae bacterium]
MSTDQKFPSEKVASEIAAPQGVRPLNQRGRVERREVLRAGAAGIIGTIFGGKSANATGLFSGLMGDSASAAEANAPRLATLGDYVWLTPTKLGGGAQVQDLATGKTMAWIEYWNYGDSCPIAHHLAAFPSADPRKGFEFVNSTQGGQNVLIYGIPTQIREHGMLDPLWGQGNQIYRVGFDGQQMNLLENVAETTGIGLGVHTVIFPDASGFTVADGQKDVVAFFNRATGNQKTTVIDAFRFDWRGNEPDGVLEDNWFKGGTVRVSRLLKAPDTGLYDYRGVKGNKLDWEMVPMGEYLAYSGQLPGDSVKTLTGADNCVHHPIHPLSLVTLRMFAVGVVIDRTTMEPVACISSPDGTTKENIPVKKIADGIWDIKLDNVVSSGHECGFGPHGKWFTMTNNTRQNSMGVFDCSDRDPRNWKRVTEFKDSHWVGSTPSPFHITYSMDGSKMFVSELHRKPAKSAIVVVDTNTWTTIKRFENVGVDLQTMHVTYDGKYVLAIFSGFQRLEGGTFIFTQDTLEPVGYIPNFGGHHDCVIVPRNNEELIHSRCTTV